MQSRVAGGHAQCQGGDAQGVNAQALRGETKGQGLLVGPLNLRPGLFHAGQGLGSNVDADRLLGVALVEAVHGDLGDVRRRQVLQVQPQAQPFLKRGAHGGIIARGLVQSHHTKLGANGRCGRGIVFQGRYRLHVHGLCHGRHQGGWKTFCHADAHHALVCLLQQTRLHVQLACLKRAGQINAPQQAFCIDVAWQLDGVQTGLR